MDRRKLRLILLVIVGFVILVVGIGAASIYSKPTVSRQAQDNVSQALYGKDYDELDFYDKAMVDSHFGWLPSIQDRNTEFKQWLVKPLKWVGIAFGLFAILTAALVVSRVISNRIKPPSNPS